MEHINPEQEKKEIQHVVGSIKLLEQDFEVKRPVFTDVEVERPKFVDREVDVPVGFDKLADKIGTMIADTALMHIVSSLEEKLDKAIKDRLDTIKSPKIVEELNIIKKDVNVEVPKFIDKEVINAIVKDKQVINAVVKNVDVNNAVIKDVEVTNAKMKNKIVVNPVFKDISIDRPVYVDKEITVIHPKYIDLKGREVNER